MNSLLSTAYWPNLHYSYYIFNCDRVEIEQYENYQKQSFRNRTTILSANGALDLSIPVRKQAPKELTKDIEISYQEPWQAKHWRAITSAYKNSPYFEHFEIEIEALYKYKHQYLLQFNLLQLQTVFKLLKVNKDILLTSDYKKEAGDHDDLREKIHPKLDFQNDPKVAALLKTTYYQTFENKFAFTANLSILDLLFNEGLGALTYLRGG